MTRAAAVNEPVAKLNYSHEAMIDLIVGSPGISQNEIARRFGYTPGWVSRIMASDGFKAQLALRRAEIVDPTLVASVEEMLEGALRQSIRVIGDSLDARPDAKLAVRVVEATTRGLGLGAAKTPVVQNNFVVAMPTPAQTPTGWLEQIRDSFAPGLPAVETKDG